MLNVGVIIGERYEVVSRIGSGGMADVYKAKDHKLNRFVAMKVLKPEFSADTNFIRKFQREAQAAAGLAHPNVVNVFDVGEDKGVNYIVMELVEGITLKEYISKKGRLTVKEATSIAIQVSMGLEAAHNRNIVHRDIKPQNIIISTDGKVKVTDFGIARVASSNTISTNAMGSVHYSSPEQVRGGYSDFKSDIYSLGITMYEMVTGRVPFDGDTTVAIAIKHLQDEMVPPSQYVQELPHSLEEIILKCTQKSPDRRYSTLAELINDLKHSLIDPNGNFVNLSPLSNHAQTIMFSPEEMKEIQNRAYQQSSGYDDDEDDGDDDYEERSSRYHRRDEDDEDDEDEDDDDERGGINTKVEKVLTIGGLIIGAIIICILIYVVASAAGILDFGGGQKKDNNTQQEESIDEVSDKVEVPDLSGKTEEEAQELVKEQSLGMQKAGEEASETIAEGLICRQDPVAGTEVDKNTQVTYYISTGKAAEEKVTIPTGLIGKTLSEVQSQLQALGLNPKIEQQKSSDVAVGNVISLNPGEGTSVAKNTEVTITVSVGEGDTYETIPNVKGMPEDQAVSAVKAVNLIPNVEYGDSDSAGVNYGDVYEISPQAGKKVEQGTIITLKVRKEQTETTENNGQETESNTQTGSDQSGQKDLKIEQPSNYDGQQLVRIRLVSGADSANAGADDGTVLLQDQVVTFTEDTNGKMVYNLGKVEYNSGDVLYFDVQDSSGDYSAIWSYNL